MKSSKSSIALCGFLVFLGLISAALIGRFVIGDPMQMDIERRLSNMSLAHPFGTDQFGRDTLAMICGGVLNSLLAAFSGVLLGALCGTILGMASAILKSEWLAKFTKLASDFVFVFPAFLTALMLNTLYGASLWNVTLAIALFNLPVFFRQSFALTRNLLAQPQLQAAKALGQTGFGMLRYHILPAGQGLWVTQISLQLALALLTEAGLSYLGLGVPLQSPSLGRMLHESQSYLDSAPHLAIFPGTVIALLVLSFYVTGDALRDQADIRRAQGI